MSPDPATAAEAKSAAKKGLDALLDTIFEIIVPIFLFVVGYFAANLLGLGAMISSLLYNTGYAPIQPYNNYIGNGISAAIWAGVGYGMWSQQDGGHGITHWLYRGVGSLFFGMATGDGVACATNKVNGKALFVTLFGQIQTQVGGD
jgi:hypothetical protein